MQFFGENKNVGKNTKVTKEFRRMLKFAVKRGEVN